MTDLVGGAQPAEVAASFQDAGLRGRLASDDWSTREAAQAQLSGIYQRAYGSGEASAGQAQSAPGGA